MPGFRRRMNRAEHRGMIETLADLPWLLLVAHRALQVAPGHVETDRVAVDMVERLLDRNIGATRFQRRHQLDLVMVVLGQRRIRMIGDGADRDVLDRVGRLLEEERRLAGRVRTHLTGMRGIVAADAIDAAGLEYVGLADDGDGDRGYRKHRFWAGLGRGGLAL